MKDKITVLKIENLKEFEGHPYKVTDNEEMDALALSMTTIYWLIKFG